MPRLFIVLLDCDKVMSEKDDHVIFVSSSASKTAQMHAEEDDGNVRKAEGSSVSDAPLNITRRIGGQRGRGTKLMQQILVIIDAKEFSRAREVSELKAQLDESHKNYVASAEEYCKSLDSGSVRYQEYVTQLHSRNEELVNLNARIAEYLLEGIEERSAARSSKFRIMSSSNKGPPKCGGTERTTSTLSSASKLRMEVRLAEVRLQQARREQELEARQERIRSEKVILQAETAVLEARTRAEAIEDQVLDEPLGVDPVMPPHDKVDEYLRSLQASPVEDYSPSLHPVLDIAVPDTHVPPSDPSPQFPAPSPKAPIPVSDSETINFRDQAVLQASKSSCVVGNTAPAFHGPATAAPSLSQEPPTSSLSLHVPGSPDNPAQVSTRHLQMPVVVDAPAYQAIKLPAPQRVSHSTSISLVDRSDGLVGHTTVDPKHNPPNVPLNHTLLPGSDSLTMGPTTPSQPNATFGLSTPANMVRPSSSLFQGPATTEFQYPFPQAQPPTGLHPAYSQAIIRSEAPPTELLPSSCFPPQFQIRPSQVNPPGTTVNRLVTTSQTSPVYTFPVKTTYPSSQASALSSSQNQHGQSKSTSIVDDMARMFVRCHGTRSLPEEEKFDGNPLQYHLFMRRVQDRILDIYGSSDPGHAFQLLLEATAGRARKIINGCIMLQPDAALANALQLLYKAFGSPDVTVKAHIKSVTEGPTIRTDERSLQDFYSDLVNCKYVLESAGALQQLNAAATLEGVFGRLPRHNQERFAELALRRGYSIDMVPFDLVIEYIDQTQQLAASRLGRLMTAQRSKSSMPGNGWTKGTSKPGRAHFVQMNSMPSPAQKDTQQTPSKVRQCTACESSAHFVWRCEKFVKMPLSDRKALVRQRHLCFNCLGTGHGVKTCPSKGRCRTCSQTHHTLLHPEDFDKPDSQRPNHDSSVASAINMETAQEDDKPSELKINASHSERVTKQLQVLPVCVINMVTGKTKQVWALLDSGADTHLMTRRLYSELNLAGKPLKSKLQLADGTIKTLDTFETKLSVRGVREESTFVLEDIRVMERLPDLVGHASAKTDLGDYQHLADVEIPEIDSDGIDLLISMDSPNLHVFSEVRQGGEGLLWAGKSPLGWVLFGRNSEDEDRKRLATSAYVSLVATSNLESTAEAICPCQFDFVDLAQDDDTCLPSLDDKDALSVMQSSCTFKGGHYCMGLPWKKGCPSLPNNYNMALSRLTSLGRRLRRDQDALVKYRNKINEMIQLGHAVEVPSPNQEDCKGRTWYIPHHCTGGKFRVVFDCSAAVEGTSLNRQLLQGPDNTNTLLGVLFRFRPHAVALIGDVRNMFHQVNVDPMDQTALRFLWWTDGNLDLAVKAYQLTVHSFGLTSSPSVAGYALRRTARENRTNASVHATSTVERNFYVDDLLTSVRSSEKAVQLLREVDALLASGGFQMAKWASNRPEVLETIPASFLAPQLHEIDLHEENLPSQKALGLV